ncbi:MAG: hypothetical protein ACI4QT_02800 [Kiritimatiellia bacterium]
MKKEIGTIAWMLAATTMAGTALAWETTVPADTSGFVLEIQSTGAREVYSGDSTLLAGTLSNGNQLRRPIFIFTLPEIPKGSHAAAQIKSAELHLGFWSLQNGNAGGDILAGVIEDVDNPGAINPDDFDETIVGEELLVVSGDAQLANETELSIDVTSVVQLILAGGQNTIAFRLRNTEENEVGGRIFCSHKHGTERLTPQLTLRVGSEFREDATIDGTITREGENYSVAATGTTLGIGDNTRDRTIRSVMKFPIPALPDGEVWDTVKLSVMLQQVYESPTLPVELFCYVSDSGELSKEDFETQTGLLAEAEAIPTDVGRDTPFVFAGEALADMARWASKNGRRYLCFRFQYAGGAAKDADDGVDLYYLGASEHPIESYRPSILFSTIPNPYSKATVFLFR